MCVICLEVHCNPEVSSCNLVILAQKSLCKVTARLCKCLGWRILAGSHQQAPSPSPPSPFFKNIVLTTLSTVRVTRRSMPLMVSPRGLKTILIIISSVLLFTALLPAGVRTGPAAASVSDGRRQGLPGPGSRLSGQYSLLHPLPRGPDHAGVRGQGRSAEGAGVGREQRETLAGAGHDGNHQHHH